VGTQSRRGGIGRGNVTRDLVAADLPLLRPWSRRNVRARYSFGRELDCPKQSAILLYRTGLWHWTGLPFTER